ncbi:MAG: TonB-dependent receptor, partial [Leptospiraceae bacterium]|nr:TonB-dependent receptor [Leptospiraceae bacterium]
AARGSYMHKTLASFAPDGVRLPIYWDAQFKLMYRLAPEHTLYLYALGAKDTFGAEIEDKQENDPTKELDPVLIGARLAFDRAFHTEAVRYEWQPGSLFRNRLTLIGHDNIIYVNGEIGDLEARQEQHDGYLSLRDDLDWELVEEHVRIEAGFELRQFRYTSNGFTVRQLDPNDESPDFFNPDEPDFETIPVEDSTIQQYNSGYAMLTLAGYGFEFKPGVRADYFALTGQTVVDPRGTLSYTFPTKTTLFGGAGVYHKVPEPWQYSPSSGNPNLFMERAEHYGGGIEQELGDWLFKVEAYRHYYTDIVVVDPYITTPYRVNSHPYERYTEPILLDDRLGYSNDGTGFSEGYEIYIKKSKPPEANGWYGWISYTWSRSLRNDHQHILTDEESRLLRTKDELRIISQYDNTKDVYADFDRTHIINVIFGYKFNREWQVGLRWRYQTSSPTTPIIDDDGGLQQNRGRTIFDPVYSDLTNSKRFKPYHQLDIRIDRFFHYGWGYGNFFVEALNLYVRRNQTGESWDRARPYSTTNPSPQYDFQILENKVDGKKYWFPFLNVGIEMKF